MPKIDEKTRRRPDFLGGQPLLMADGQDWWFPKPRLRFAPSDDSNGFTTVLDGGDGYQDLFDAYRAVYDDENSTGPERVRVELSLGTFLLLRNYDLTTQELRSILQFSFDEEGDPEGRRIRDQVLDVAFGNTPDTKRPAGTSV